MAEWNWYAQRAVGVACAAVLAGLLVSCSPLDRAAARLDDDVLIFAFCEAFEADVMEVTSRDAVPSPPPPKVIWLADGKGQLDEAEVVSFGTPPTGFENHTFIADLDVEPNNFRVNVRRLDRDGHTVASMSAGFEGAALEESRWLRQDGSYSDQPC
jgi:hypothetical protein